MRYGLISVEDACNFFQRGTLRLNIEEVDECELDTDPQRVEEGEVPVLG